MRFNAWGLTDVGRKRDHNEDGFVVDIEFGLYAVADGMGGHQGGEQASRMAIEILRREINGVAFGPPNGVLPINSPAAVALRRAAQRASCDIYDAAQENPDLSGMGTTLTALLVHGGRAHVAHVGDSRCYLFRDGRCVPLTEDHSWVNEQVRAGFLSEEDARESRFKHIITRSVGFERSVQVDGNSVAIEPGDCFLLCSDGLSNHIETEELGRLVNSSFYRDVPRLLVDLANDRGGDDNVTVVMIHAANSAAV